MTDEQRVRTDQWQRALGPDRLPERRRRRPKPGPGRYRPADTRTDPWLRALSGPPISTGRRAS